MALGNQFYVRRDGLEKIYTRATMTRGDTVDSYEASYSLDNGGTLPNWTAAKTSFKTAKGARRLSTNSQLGGPG